MTIRKELIDELLNECADPQEILGEGGLLKQLTKAIIERCLETELQTHLGYGKHEHKEEGVTNSRNGSSNKTVKGEQGHLQLSIPRDRESSFEPQLIKKHQTRLEGLDEKILILYSHGLTTRDIQAQLQEMYGVEISPTLISSVTDAVSDEVRQWQSRPLEAVYPIVYVDCLVVKVRENQRVINKALHLVLGVTMQGHKELLGMWITQNEGAKFWLSVFTELQNRGVKDIFLTCVDGLTGLPEAMETVFPQTRVQLCMVHMVRNSLRYVSHKHAKEVAADLKLIYTASTEGEAELNLELFAEKWDGQYPTISATWRARWSRIIPLFAFSQDIRKAIYTTNAIESVNMTLRKMTRNRRIFPSDESVFKVMYLAIQTVAKK
ncbi:IS256 family transposase [Dictyobacter aurantiacus]|uniref:Mutator family transposase n=1 Tax=Dictyobacter aurantiacus TaxID=1936993 RepID=A0A401ZQW1_9CHLR|nr:IS256 family transposase [Dictyobacter aurantiacus]